MGANNTGSTTVIIGSVIVFICIISALVGNLFVFVLYLLVSQILNASLFFKKIQQIFNKVLIPHFSANVVKC